MGKRVADVMARGELVTDEIVIGLIREQLEAAPDKSFIFDGFPRTLPQAKALTDLLAELGMKMDAAIELRVREDALIKRIVGRAEEAAAKGEPVRADDNEESLRVRLMEYYKKTSPIMGYYFAFDQLKRIDGMAEMPLVKAQLGALLDSL
jgi:adenylate kinase